MKVSRLIIGCLILCYLFLLGCSKDENLHPDFDGSLTLEQNVDAFVGNYVKGDSPGISIQVRRGSEILLKKSYGFANIQDQSPVTENTPFYLASVSKQITAMTTMILAERGQISYENPISTYLNEVPDSWSEITIHHLLTHRSGLADYLSDLNWYSTGLTNNKVLQDLIVYEQLEFEPGTKYEYSNSGYTLLAIITERVSGKAFQEFLKDEIFDLLNMNRSLGYDVSRPSVPGRAIGYTNSGQLDDYELLTMGDGGLFSTINDLDKWERSFVNNDLVSELTKLRAFTSHHSDGYGYGWVVGEVGGATWYSHGGGLNGYRTFISRFPAQDFSIIMLSNGTFDWLGALHDEIIKNSL